MAASISPAQAQAMFKQIYGDDFLRACPVEKQLHDDFPFAEGDEPGEAFVQAIRMTEEQGFTFRKGGSGAGRMRDPIALKTERATILGDILEFRSRIDGEVMRRAMNSKQAFKEHVGLRMEAMRDSAVKHEEWTFLNGGRPVGVIKTGGITGSGATRTVTLTDDSYAEGFWSSSENMPFDIYDTTSASLSESAVKRNTSSADAVFRVTGYDQDAKTVTLTADDADDWTNVVAGDCLWRASSYLNESPGLIAITANQSAVINGISAATYPSWRGIVKNVGGPLTMALVLQMAARQASRNGTKSRFTLRCSPKTFAVLASDLAAARRYDGSYSHVKGTNGYGAIEYYAPNGVIAIKTHTFCKDGEAHFSDDSKVKRRGVRDLSFQAPNAVSGEYFLYVADYDQVEYRANSQQGMFNERPVSSGLFTGLTVPA